MNTNEVCMDLIRICESDNWFVDYDRERGMYRVSYFEDNHFKDECWFDEYKEATEGETLQQVLNEINPPSVLEDLSPEEWEEIVDKFNSIPYTNVISYSNLVEAMENQEDVVGDTIKKLSDNT